MVSVSLRVFFFFNRNLISATGVGLDFTAFKNMCYSTEHFQCKTVVHVFTYSTTLFDYDCSLYKIR